LIKRVHTFIHPIPPAANWSYACIEYVSSLSNPATETLTTFYIAMHPPAADWSYACIEYVSSLADPRNLATLLLYAVLAYLALAARPWRVLQEWSGHREVGAVRFVCTAVWSVAWAYWCLQVG